MMSRLTVFTYLAALSTIIGESFPLIFYFCTLDKNDKYSDVCNSRRGSAIIQLIPFLMWRAVLSINEN